MKQETFNEITSRYADHITAAQWKVIAQLKIEDPEELKSRLDYYAQTNNE